MSSVEQESPPCSRAICWSAEVLRFLGAVHWIDGTVYSRNVPVSANLSCPRKGIRRKSNALPSVVQGPRVASIVDAQGFCSAVVEANSRPEENLADDFCGVVIP